MGNSQNAPKEYPLATVGMLIFSPRRKCLLVKSHKWDDCYTVPGGKVEWGESCRDAVIREVKEETNLEVVNVQFAFVQEAIFSDQFWKKAHLIMHDYIGELQSGFSESDVQLNSEAQSFVWASPQEVAQLRLTRETAQLWEWAELNYLI
jgi:ADP-ribose pyrophosphatase YjhB (NUDIX family)